MWQPGRIWNYACLNKTKKRKLLDENKKARKKTIEKEKRKQEKKKAGLIHVTKLNLVL